MSSSTGRLAERFIVAADRFPQIDAVIVARPDLRVESAKRFASMLAERDDKRTEAEHLKHLSVDLPPGTMDLSNWRERGLNKSMSGVGLPRIIKQGVVSYGYPKWHLFVYWPRADASVVRLFNTLCTEAGELLGSSGQGDKPHQSWLIHLAERQRVKWVQDDLPPEDFPFQGVGWRETDGADTDWWAVVLENVLNLSARALREPIPTAARLGKKSSFVKPAHTQRGRKPTNLKGDARVWNAWSTGRYATYADLARELGVKVADVERAVDRARKRRDNESV